MNGFRLAKPPTRRQLAHTLAEAIPIVNAHSGGMDHFQARITSAETRLAALEEARHAWDRQTWWNRVQWVLRGARG